MCASEQSFEVMKQKARENCASSRLPLIPIGETTFNKYLYTLQTVREVLPCGDHNEAENSNSDNHVSGTSYVSHNSTSSSGFVSPSYLTGHMRTRFIALLLDINSCVARVGLLTRVPVSSTVNVVLGVNLVASYSTGSIVSLLGLVEPASTPTALCILQAEFCANSITRTQRYFTCNLPFRKVCATNLDPIETCPKIWTLSGAGGGCVDLDN
uniref:Uncharacterized protein n=1 Tax=Glossina austeni TaxID=7395 RepID=A0A1A9VWB6_GLOAU